MLITLKKRIRPQTQESSQYNCTPSFFSSRRHIHLANQAKRSTVTAYTFNPDPKFAHSLVLSKNFVIQKCGNRPAEMTAIVDSRAPSRCP